MKLSPSANRNLSFLAQQWVGNVLLLGAFLFSFIGILDYVITPENFKVFMLLRVIMSCVLLALYLLNRLKMETRYQYAMIFAAGILSSIAIEFMVLKLGGPQSTYYAGFIIIVMCCLGFVPMSLAQASLLGGAVCAIYVVPLMSLPALADPVFINNNIFLFSICVIALALRRQSQKRIVNELMLQEALESRGQQLQRSAKEMRDQNEEMKSFAYIVSHDLRAPLVNIKGFSFELREAIKELKDAIREVLPSLDEKLRKRVDALLGQDVREALDFIGSSVDRMDGQISAILTLSRLGRRELKPERIDMRALVRSIMDSLAHQLEQRRVKVSVGELPEIVADKVSMEQILGNLLDNAVKYLEPGRAGEITIAGEGGPDECIFRVRDNGRGIAAEDLHKVFELFRRAGKQDVPGEGMGLTYVKALVRRHGGRIWCESQLESGSTFSFTIPHNPQLIQ